MAAGFSRALLGVVGAALVTLIGAVSTAHAADRPLTDRATPAILRDLFPTADRLGPVEGNPPFMRAYAGEEELGYVFSTYDVVRAPSYSPTPFDAIVGMGLDGRLAGTRVISFSDPYLTGFPERVARLATFFAAYVGYHVDGTGAAPLEPDFVQGTTISARAMRAGVLDAGRVILRANGGMPDVAEPTLDVDGFVWLQWNDLVAMGGVAHRRVTYGAVREAFAATGAVPDDASLEVPLGLPASILSDVRFDCRFASVRACSARTALVHPDDEIYSDLFVALVTPAIIGRNVLGTDHYSRFVASQPEGTLSLAVMSRGEYDYRGRNYLRDETGNVLDRVKVVQGDREFIFRREQHQLLGPVFPPGTSPVTDASLFRIPAGSPFDPLAPFSVVLMVHATDAGGARATIEFPVEYQLPDDAVLFPYVEPAPPWVEAWIASIPRLAVLGGALLVLTALFVFQKRLAMSRSLHRWIRNGFLLFTLVWLGWMAGGQLSIVHIVNYLKGPFNGVDLGFYLAEPLIVVLSVYVLLSLVVIGRGVFCGWLCPFGALQELTSKVARFLRLPSWNPSERVQRWMWLPKYGTAALIVGTAFVAPQALAGTEEIEPFKTAITSAFTRPWPYVTYAVVLLVLGLFTERFYCRFLCPLGGILALGDRLHIFTFLKRRSECGTSCHLCERSCPVKAIERSGKIVMAECFQCLDCQVEYYDDHRCPPLAAQRKRREREHVVRPQLAPVPALAIGRHASLSRQGINPAPER
ncbi:MAG: 4Fe-4S binding protein [Bauldia sp.]|nr:4Fe-4S binding protein [Bauldia sp.]